MESLWNAVKEGVSNLNSLADIEDPERAKSILLGGLIGGGTTVLANTPGIQKLIGDEGVFEEEKRLKKIRQDLIKEVNLANQDFTRFDVFENEIDTKVSLTKEGDKLYASLDDGAKTEQTVEQ